jgi:hypothetical protein
MKVVKIISFVIALGALAFYAYQLFGNPNGKVYDVDKNHHVYYQGDGVTKEDAKKVGAYFMEIGYFKTDNEVDVQISSNKEKSDLKISYIVDKDKITPELERGYVLISSSLAENAFHRKKILVTLVDEHMDEIKNLGYTQPVQMQEQSNK